ncbi:MAG TPA: hypothetical protein VFP80_13640 [Thermoanaerobaculia bacterium]|nr:hypothetical protein [Thermoanaerobaculia bacterium]
MRKTMLCALALAASPIFAQPVEVKLRVIDADTPTRKKDTNFVLAATSGFSVVQALGNYFLYGSTISTAAWQSNGVGFWDLRFPVPNHPDWRPNIPDDKTKCDPKDDPTLRDKRCGDASHVVWKSTSSTDPRWTYFNSVSGTNATIPQFATVGSWPYQWPGDWDKTGIPGQRTTVDAWKINQAVPNPVPPTSTPVQCTRDDWNPKYLATGAADTKAVYVASANKWYMGFCETVNNPSPEGGWTAADQFNVGWATSADGKNWTIKRILFRTVRERTECNGGLLLTQVFTDNNYFYMVVNELGAGTILLRAAVNTGTADGFNAWQIAARDPLNANRYRWVNTPADGMLDTSPSGLNAFFIMPTVAYVKQTAIGRVFTSAAPFSTSLYIGVTVQDLGDGNPTMQLWTAPDLDTAFTPQSTIDTAWIAPVPIWNWELTFTNYPDNVPATPRMAGNEFDFWLVGNFGNAVEGHTREFTGYRVTATLSGGIYAPRGGFRTSSGAHYVSMDMSSMTATATTLGSFERFVIIDSNGGVLNSGDTVALLARNGRYLSNGGGTGLTPLAPFAGTNEQYVIEKKNAGPSQIVNGDTIAFRAVSNSKYIIAVNGGGSTVTSGGLVTNPNTRFVFVAN